MNKQPNNFFAMNMLRPKSASRGTLCGFMRNFVHETTDGELISSFTGTYTGGQSGTITCALGDNYGALGETIHIALYIGFSFATECPGLTGALSTGSKTDGWYYYAKVEWWPGGGRVTEEGIETPTATNTRTTVGYENLWSYGDWTTYGIIMNTAKWVCIGIASEVFACGKIIS